MNEEKTIKYKENGSPLSIEIKANYATLGSYSIAYTLGGKTFQLGNGKLGDNVPDVFILPVSVSELPDCDVFISGTYVPSPGHEQVDVVYLFLQNGVPASGDNPIHMQFKQPALSSSHIIHFNPE